MKEFKGYMIPENIEASAINAKENFIKIILFLMTIGLYKFMGSYKITVEIKAFIAVFVFSFALMLIDGRYNNKSILKIIKDKYIYDKKQHRYRYILK